MMKWEKGLLGIVVPLFFVSTVASTSVPVQAQERTQHSDQTYNDIREHRDNRSDRRHNKRRNKIDGGDILLGIGGLILGGIIASELNDNDRYYQDYDGRWRHRYKPYRGNSYTRPSRRREYFRTCFDEQIVYRDYYGRRRIRYERRCR